MSEWAEDEAAAHRHALTHARQLKYPPHWVRCNFMRNGIRCCKGEGHEKGANKEHEEPKL